MKAIILAAGRGTRLNKYTQDLPKGMLNVFGKPILQHQVDLYRKIGITDITIVRGYQEKKITIPGVKYYTNTAYATTNMVESLFCAENELFGDIIISYADIVFDDHFMKKILADKNDIGVAVDMDWKKYWLARYDKVDFDTESLKLADDGSITQLGDSNPPLDQIDGRYVGLIKLSAKGVELFREVYAEGKSKYAGTHWPSNRIFEQMFMTDFLNEIIRQGHKIQGLKVTNGWLEFDTNEDYEKGLEWEKTGRLKEFIRL